MNRTVRVERGSRAVDELLISASPYGMRAAAVADGQPVAFFIDSLARPSRLGDVHAARVLGRMTGIGACVLDIGGGEEAFLPNARGLGSGGDPLIVQILCDAYGEKRARVTRKPVLAGRYAVFRPGGAGVTFSRRLRDANAKQALAGIDVSGGALTVRAAAAARPEAVPAVAAALAARWREIETHARRDPAPQRLWRAGGLLGRLLRDVAAPGIAGIPIDDEATLTQAQALAEEEAPDLAPVLSLAPASPPLFERHDCAGRLAAALEPEIVLPGGAQLTIEETRALAAIDVDTSQAADTAAAETAEACGREIVLRNLGGLIAIDLAGRGGRRREAQLAALGRALLQDRTPHRVLGVSAGGLVEVNRQRLGPSLLGALTEPVSGMLGGRRTRLDVAAHEAALALRREAASGARALTLRAAPALLQALTAPGDDALARWLGVPLTLLPDPARLHGGYAIERGGAPAPGGARGACSTR